MNDACRFFLLACLYGFGACLVMAQNNPSLAPFHSWGRPAVFRRLYRYFFVWRMEPGTGAAAGILFFGNGFGWPRIYMGNTPSPAEIDTFF